MRPIDADAVLDRYYAEYERQDICDGAEDREWLMKCLNEAPTLTPQNEPLTLISMSDEIPPDNERVLVYRPCMVDSDTGPYSVQWGWAAKRDGSHWARLPDRRPPEGEEGDADCG